ncbi:hypothetical protein ScPMuIL_005893 [Solemya velum]
MDTEEGEIVEPPVKRLCLESINDVTDNATVRTDNEVTEEGEIVEQPADGTMSPGIEEGELVETATEQVCIKSASKMLSSASQLSGGEITGEDCPKASFPGKACSKAAESKLKIHVHKPSSPVTEEDELVELGTRQSSLKDTDSVLDSGLLMPGSPITEFEIIDDLDEEGQGNEESDYMESVGLDPSDEDLDDNEIYAWLEEGIDKQAVQGTGISGTSPIEREKVVLKERGHDPFELLPEGWVVVTHDSGMPVYLDKQSRVCTLSKPYFLGPGSVRKHDIPLGAIPCLQYRREIEKEKGKENNPVSADICTPDNNTTTCEAGTISCPLKSMENREVSESKDCAVNDEDRPNEEMRDEDTQSTLQDKKKTESCNGEIASVDNIDSGTLNVEPNSIDRQLAEITKEKTKTVLMNGEINMDEATQRENAESMDMDMSTTSPGTSQHTDINNKQELANSDVLLPSVRIESAEERKKLNSLDYREVRKYCEKLFEFKVITVKKFKTWKDRRRHLNTQKRQSRPALPSSTKLITCPVPQEKGENKAKRKEFVLNPLGKSYVCILHEYAQHTMRLQPRYTFKELENAHNPYSATVVISDVQYGTGYASSKKAAKMQAAKATLRILIPEMNKMEDKESNDTVEDLSFFDEIKIEDPRVSELCNKAGQPSPYQILLECLKRNYGMGDTNCQFQMQPLKQQKSEFTLNVGKRQATVVCKNKREGKQRAAQAMLQLLHPHITSLGSLLRLYGRSSSIGMKEKKKEEHSITELQAHACSNKPNFAVLKKLKVEMCKIQEQKESIKSKGKIRIDSASLPGQIKGLDL